MVCVRMRKKLAKHPCSRVSRRLQVCQRRRRHLPENIRASPVFFLDAEERQGQVMMKGFSPPPLSLSLPLCTSLLHSLSHSLSANLWLCLVHSLTHTHTHPLSLKTSLLSQKQSYSLPLSLSIPLSPALSGFLSKLKILISI